MRDVNNCPNRRYKILDELISDVHSAIPRQDSKMEKQVTEDDSAKLMCHLWNVLEEDPDRNLSQTDQQYMGFDRNNNCFSQQQHVKCYMANNCRKDDADKKNKEERPCNMKIKEGSSKSSRLCPKCSSKLASKSNTSDMGKDSIPLSQVLCNLKEAASYDKKCKAKLNGLMETQKLLQEQIQKLEERENAGVEMLKQADCMWSCMEVTYKKKIQESNEKQTYLLEKLKEAEASASKWRKYKKDLETDIAGIIKCQLEFDEKTNDKTNESIHLDKEIMELGRKIDNGNHEADVAFKSLRSKKETSDIKLEAIATDMKRLQKELNEEGKRKQSKEQDGAKFVKEARDEIKNLCKVLLLKRLKNENIEAEKQNILTEIELQNDNFQRCRDRCSSKDKYLDKKLKKLKTEVENFRAQCIRCHKCTDTVDIRKFCIDCPRCLAEKCFYENGQCILDNATDCVCMRIKQKLLDNIFGHMYTVLERKSKMEPGKLVADSIITCLKRSKNGKLDEPTRNIIQNFILTTVRKSLNLTVVGGAIKTRCEMDQDTYKQMMICLEQVKVTKPPKADKGTGIRKPCSRWGGTSECNCPKGPKNCVCTKKKGLRLPGDPTPCTSETKTGDKRKNNEGEIKSCGSKGDICEVDCPMHNAPSNVGHDVSWNSQPCRQSSQIQRNMRSVQCSLGPEILSATIPAVEIDDEVPSKTPSGEKSKKVCPDGKSLPRSRVIEEVMGQYTEVTPIQKVRSYKSLNSSNESF